MRTTFHKVPGEQPTYAVFRGTAAIGHVHKDDRTWTARVWMNGRRQGGFATRQAAASWIRQNRAQQVVQA